MKLWEKNFEINKEIERFTVGRDREMDLYLAKYDVLGSMAHITMLESIGLLEKEELTALLAELRNIYHLAEPFKEDCEKRLDSSVVLMICDIDDFKIHNDTFGHEHGDDVLESFARNLVKVFGTEYCYRYGGDEFLVMMNGDNLEMFINKFEECRQNVGDAYHFSGGYVYGYPRIHEDFQRLINQADNNLYKAKQNGKNQIIGG